MADWQKIKTEYITTNTSYRKLAKKHGVHYNAIANKAKQEKWVAQRNQFYDSTVTKTIGVISDQQADNAAELVATAGLLLANVKILIESDSEVLRNTKSMKNISGVLKDIKEVLMIRSDADIREQNARIRNLEKQADREEDGSTEITVTFGSEDAQKWAK